MHELDKLRRNDMRDALFDVRVVCTHGEGALHIHMHARFVYVTLTHMFCVAVRSPAPVPIRHCARLVT